MASTAAQDEFNNLVSRNAARSKLHPEDRDDASASDRDQQQRRRNDDIDEETYHQRAQIDAAMRVPTGAAELKLPPASFDSGRTTGVKGVIADARSFQAARQLKWIDRARSARKTIFGGAASNGARSDSETDDDAQGAANHSDEESFLQQWRESRRRELESSSTSGVRNRRTSPSVRVYGRLDEVDAMGYLDAIEKVHREAKVVVFVHDNECAVSASIEEAILPLVRDHPTIHFVKVHYDDIEFDPAAVPSLLAYQNQGDLFANLTGIIEMMPNDDTFGSDALAKILRQHKVL
ncbi:hypothetical protein RJ55_07594 [Drechmeria coniospora]|nr:hypothetical protein RJ55_07594 [Drechmeria coniospora]